MSENTLPEDTPQLVASAPDAAIPASPVPAYPCGPAVAGAPLLMPPPPVPPEMAALLELIGRGLASDADDATRAMARELWARCAQAIVAAATTPPAAPVALPGSALAVAHPAPVPVAMPTIPAMPALPAPASSIAMAAQTLRGMPSDQLLDLALQRLRAALPPGAAPATPKGIQFQLVPVPPPTPTR